MVKKYFPYIPVVILVGAILYSLYVVNTTNIILGTKQHFGIAFVVAGIILSFAKKDFGIYIIGAALLLGTLNIIAFTPTIESYSLGFSFNKRGVDFKIQPFSFLVLLIYVIVNFRSLQALFRKAPKDSLIRARDQKKQE